MKYVLAVVAVCLLQACSNVSEPPLPEIHSSDPVWPLTPDHLEYGRLPL